MNPNALHEACQRADLPAVMAILKSADNPPMLTIQPGPGELTPLHWAAIVGDLAIIDALIDVAHELDFIEFDPFNSIDCRDKAPRFENAIECATRLGKEPLVELLRSGG